MHEGRAGDVCLTRTAEHVVQVACTDDDTGLATRVAGIAATIDAAANGNLSLHEG